MELSIESITRRVSATYDLFPYPSPATGIQNLKGLANLLTIFSRETAYDFRGKTVLDAGTGTGHHLLEAAAALKDTAFVAIDVSGRPLAIARETAKAQHVDNVRFQRVDLMDTSVDLGRFDVILCMGVLHHLADPVRGMRNLVRSLSDNGLLFFYVHGTHGSRERIRRKQILSTLLGGNGRDFDRGIEMIRDLGFDPVSYGWNLNIDDERTKESVCVHSYLNVHESLFDADSVFNLAQSSQLESFVTYGISIGQTGLLFESRLNAPPDTLLPRTDISTKLSTPRLCEAYERLNLRDRYRLIDLFYQPSGYVVIGLKCPAARLFPGDSRVVQNAVDATADWSRRE
jgi:SAM-dependent methyltransferase